MPRGRAKKKPGLLGNSSYGLGLDVGYLGVDLSLSDDVMPRWRVKPPRGVFHIHMTSMQSV
jgi:hypothetical protein